MKMTRIAFIGAGEVAERHFEGIRACENAELAGLWNRNRARAEEKSARFECRLYESPAELVADPEVDAVFVLTDLETHHQYARLALEAGKHVLVEKPVAADADQIRDLRDLAAEKGLWCVPGHNYIYEQGLMRTRAMLRAGKLGRLVSVHILYNIAHAEEVAARYPGVIRQIMTHHAYMLLYLAGPPVRLSAMKASLHYKSIAQEDIAMVNLQLEDGALAHFGASFAADDHSGDPWTMIVKVLGTEGAAHFSYRDRVEYRSGEAHSLTYAAYPESIIQEVDHFINSCIRRNRVPLSTMDDALRAHEIVTAIERAAETGQTIELQETPRARSEACRRISPCPPGVPVVGVDIGGTKTAISIWEGHGHPEELCRFQTGSPEDLLAHLKRVIARRKTPPLFGIACGGPLDAKTGTILRPPNLPSWDHVPVVGMLETEFGCRAFLMNDANANAVAEWKFGAGRGTETMIFLTAGTGMGAGIIAGGCLLDGANGNAGEVGHIRLAPNGPEGYGKAGSFEGFCSGGGIAQLAAHLPPGIPLKIRRAWMRRHPSAKEIVLAARNGDLIALAVLQTAGERLGEALAILVDVLNPERIILGTLFRVARPFLEPSMRAALAREALAPSLGACRIVPAKLGKHLGNYGAVCAALYHISPQPL